MSKLVRCHISKLFLSAVPILGFTVLAACEITPSEPVLEGKVEQVNTGMAGPNAMAAPESVPAQAMNAPAQGEARPEPQANAQATTGGRDLSSVAASLGKSEADIRAALAAAGGPPPDLAMASQTLGVTQQALRTALQAARGNAAPAGMAGPNGMVGPNGMTGPNAMAAPE